ncbi:MAG: 6-bladed beta-propeller [Bacteroidota bacterium]
MKYILFVLVIIVFACKEPASYNTIKINSTESSSGINDRLLNEVEIEQYEGIFIEQIDDIKVSKNFIFILDKSNSALYQFRKNGKFVRKFDQFGEAPHEFLNLNDFDLDEKAKIIYLLSVDDRKLISYDFNGNFLNSIRLDFQAFQLAVLDQKLLVFRGSFFDANNSNIKIVDIETNKIVNELSSFPDGIFPINLDNITGSLNKTESVLVNEPLTYDIYEVKNNELELKYKLDVPENEKWDQTKKYDFNDFFEKLSFNDYTYLSPVILENDDWVFIKYNKKDSKKMVNHKKLIFHKEKQKVFPFEETLFDVKYKKTVTAYDDAFVAYNIDTEEATEQIKVYFYKIEFEKSN